MGSILITTKCNFSCPYCSVKMYGENPDIEPDKFKELLTVMSESDEGRGIDIVGGEPFLHPQIKEILQVLNEHVRNYPGRYRIYTNGVYLDRYLNLISENVKLDIKLNNPRFMSVEDHIRLTESLDHIYELGWFETRKVTLNLTIYHGYEDQEYVYDIIKKYHATHIRVNFAPPFYGGWLSDRELFYSMGALLVSKIFRRFKELKVKAIIDRNWIPHCYFTEEDFYMVREVSTNGKFDRLKLHLNWCPVDYVFNGNFEVMACQACAKRSHLVLFPSNNQIRRFIGKRFLDPLTEYNHYGRCEGCQEFYLSKCQGGCLAFAQVNRQKLEAKSNA